MYKKLLCAIFILYFSSILPSKSYIFIDIDDCDLPSGKSLRIIHFDTEAQKYLSVNYYSLPQTPSEDWCLQEACGVMYSYTGNVQLPVDKDLTNYVIRTKGNFNSSKKVFIGVSGDKYLFRGTKTKPEKAEDIYKKLGVFTMIPNEILQLFLNGTPQPKKTIFGNSNTALYNRECRNLGELATEMTFISFGYYKLESQNNSDHGLDGVYVDNIIRPLSLFLTESKHRSESKSAESYMDEDLSEAEIYRKIAICPPETQTIIKSFIQYKPFTTYKLVQRIKGNGSQICIHPFDQKSYRAFLLKAYPHLLTEEDHIAILEDLMERMVIKTQTAQKKEAETEGLRGRATIKVDHFLDEDSTDLLEFQLNNLTPKYIKKIIEKLKTVPSEKRQVIFDLAFRSILGYADNASFILEEEMLSTIDSLVHALASTNEGQFDHVYEVAKTVFGSDYNKTALFDLADRLSIFHSFLNSPHNHLQDVQNRADLLYTYHMIYDNLKEMKIDPEEIQHPVYLASFVETFKTLTDADLEDIHKTVSYIYDTETYSDQKGSHNCEDWELLAIQLRSLTTEQRETLSNFLSWFPSTFNFGPADTIEKFKEKRWMDEIDRLEKFEDLDLLTKKAFEIYTDQDEQLDALNLIISGLIDGKTHDKIMKKVKKLSELYR